MATLGNTPRPAYVYDTETDTWVPVGVGAHTHDYIPNTLVDAKGDILTATADNVPARLAKGADGTVLVSDSTTSTGLAWQPYAAQSVAGKNLIINGGFDIWQRGTTFNTAQTNDYTADRWFAYHDSVNSLNVTRQDIASSGLGVRYALRAERSSGTARWTMIHIAEGAMSCIGKTMTLSGYVRKGPNLTSSVDISISTRAVKYGAGYDSVGFSFSAASLSTTTWTYFQRSFTITTATSTNNADLFELEVTGTSQAGSSGAYFEIAGMQLEVGSVATPFSRAGGTLQGELAACQRYYYKIGTEGSSSSFFFSPLGMANATTQVIVTIPFPQVMRVKPTSIDYSSPRVWDGVNTAVTATSLTFGDASTTSGSINANGSGFTLYRPYWLMNNSGSYIGFNAEL